MMAESGAKEPPIAGQAAIRILKQHMVKEPILEAAPSRSKELFAVAIGAPRDLNVRSGFVHGKILCRERPLGGRGLKSCERLPAPSRRFRIIKRADRRLYCHF